MYQPGRLMPERLRSGHCPSHRASCLLPGRILEDISAQATEIVHTPHMPDVHQVAQPSDRQGHGQRQNDHSDLDTISLPNVSDLQVLHRNIKLSRASLVTHIYSFT